MRRSVFAFLLFASTLLAQAFDPSLLHHFDYNQKAPLDIQQVGVEQRGDVTVLDISYASPKGDACPPTSSSPKEKVRLPPLSGDTGIRTAPHF